LAPRAFCSTIGHGRIGRPPDKRGFRTAFPAVLYAARPAEGAMEVKKSGRPRRNREKAIQELEAVAASLKPLSGSGGENRELVEALQEYDRAIRAAIRAGVIDHPLVVAWIHAKRSVKDWGALRELRMGLEKGATQWSAENAWIAQEAGDLMEAGTDVKEIQRALLQLVDDARKPLVPIVEDTPAVRARLRRLLLTSTKAFRGRLHRLGLRPFDP